MVYSHVESRSPHISWPEATLLVVIALLLHGLLYWVLAHRAAETQVETPQQLAAAGERSVTVELSAAAPQQEQSEPSVEPQPMKEPEPQPDEDAVTPPPEPIKAEKTPPKKRVQSKKQTLSKAVPAPQKSPQGQRGATVEKSSTGNPAGASGQSITPAVSGMQSLGNPPPEYPPLALRRKQQGSVVLRILVLESGRAGQVTVDRSSHSELLDQAAVKTVQQWRFIPAKRGATPIKGYAIQTITFTLPE